MICLSMLKVDNSFRTFSSILTSCCCSVTKLCLTLCDPTDCNTPGFSDLSEFAQTHVHWVGNAIQPSHPLLFPSLPCLLSFPASGSFLMSQLFTSGGQSIGASALASVLVNIQDWFPLGLDWFDLLEVWGTLKSHLQHHNLKAPILWHSAFFMVQFSHPYMITGKTMPLTLASLVAQMVKNLPAM